MKLKKIYYWSPYLVPIATPLAIINSANALHKFGKMKYDCSIINFFGEFNFYRKKLQENNIRLINKFNDNFLKILPKEGKIKSRLSFLIIFFSSFFPLRNLIKSQKPDYLVVQLISSLPMILILLFQFETKFILRISGLPKLNIIRKFLWKIALRNFFLVTCPTQTTYEHIKSLKIVDNSKIKLLYDPILDIKKVNLLKKKQNPINITDYYLAAGRLTKQKNFLFLCKAFHQITLRYPEIKLVIAGDGEDKEFLLNYIKKNNLKKKIFLVGYVENLFPVMNQSKGFILSSLWEDPGFVLIEAAFSRKLVFSSDCLPGPKEIIQDNINGVSFTSNDLSSFINKFENFINCQNKKKFLLNNLINSKKFTLFHHYKSFNSML